MKKQFFAVIFLLAGFTASAQKIPYTNCEKCWLPDSLGNHRVVLTFKGSSANIAVATIPWRRRDDNPQNKRVILVDAATNKKITNVVVDDVTRESGRITFQPTSGKGTYYVY